MTRAPSSGRTPAHLVCGKSRGASGRTPEAWEVPWRALGTPGAPRATRGPVQKTAHRDSRGPWSRGRKSGYSAAILAAVRVLPSQRSPSIAERHAVCGVRQAGAVRVETASRNRASPIWLALRVLPALLELCLQSGEQVRAHGVLRLSMQPTHCQHRVLSGGAEAGGNEQQPVVGGLDVLSLVCAYRPRGCRRPRGRRRPGGPRVCSLVFVGEPFFESHVVPICRGPHN